VASLLVLLAVVLCLWAAPCRAHQEAGLTDIVVTNTRDDLLVYFVVTHCFTEGMERAIQNGIPTTFTFYVELQEKGEWLWNKTIAEVTLRHEVRYDNLKKLYEVHVPERNQKLVQVADLEDAKKLMSEVVGLKVTELKNLRKGRRYQVRMMAELDKIRLPFQLHYLLFFLSLWDFETDWYSVEFQY